MDDQIITQQDLEQYGISVEPNQLEDFLDHVNDTLQERIGAELTEDLTDDQIDELVDLQDKGDEVVVGQWLIDNIGQKTIAEVYEQERDILLGELVDNTEDISQTD